MKTANASALIICSIQAMNMTGTSPSILLAMGMVLASLAISGCGGSSSKGDTAPSSDSTSIVSNQYVQLLNDIREVVPVEGSFDAYGYAEYLPATQRAAIDAFCFVADQVLKGAKEGGLEGPSLVTQITRKAEADLKAERDIVAPGPTRRAIEKLRTVLKLESLHRDLAENYVRACYR